ncbi:hypothetical protein [Microbacterium arborescens]|uniref:hypothetical protein n=1 Tax=Microbacterium arborescens TaxID=33883 RepID=UPI00278359D3|nr:hypothetical protein [Microbacterium arborescens]MDQ1218146.1 hypothetical protein [Microbacterium arborescens]
MAETIVVKTPGGRKRFMSADEYDALRERAVTHAVRVSRQVDDEAETSELSTQ